MATIEVTTEDYRKASKEFFLALKEESTTLEQADNGFKCLGLMYFGLSDEEFDNEKLQEVKTSENARVLNMASEWFLQWKLDNGHPIT